MTIAAFQIQGFLLFWVAFESFGYECGEPHFEPKINLTEISDWEESEAYSWPWQAVVYQVKPNGVICGGALIAPQWVITTGHCVTTIGNEPKMLRIKLGGTNLGSDPGSGSRDRTTTTTSPRLLQQRTVQILDVGEIINHPAYNSTMLTNDLSLLKLVKPAKMTGYVLPVCLSDQKKHRLKDGDLGVVTGWGAIYHIPLNPLEKLHQTGIEIINKHECQTRYHTIQLDSSVFCAVAKLTDEESCYADFGAPLVVKRKQKWFLHGLIAWEPCAIPGFPGLYSNVRTQMEWITGVIKNTKSTKQP